MRLILLLTLILTLSPTHAVSLGPTQEQINSQKDLQNLCVQERTKQCIKACEKAKDKNCVPMCTSMIKNECRQAGE